MTALVLSTTVAALAISGCAAPNADTAAQVTQPWTGVSPTGNAIDLGAVVAGITDPAGQNRDALTVVIPAVAAGRVSATCTTDTVRLLVDGWHIAATDGTQALTVENPDMGLPTADIDVTTPVDNVPQSITFRDDGRIDITAAADTPTAWATPGRLYVGATVTCKSDDNH